MVGKHNSTDISAVITVFYDDLRIKVQCHALKLSGKSGRPKFTLETFAILTLKCKLNYNKLSCEKYWHLECYTYMPNSSRTDQCLFTNWSGPCDRVGEMLLFRYDLKRSLGNNLRSLAGVLVHKTRT